MSKTSRHITATPGRGGRLASDLSANTVGLANYRVKRDFRRDRDVEVRSEGYAAFRPNTDADAASQCWPSGPNAGEALTLAVMAGKPNGRTAVVVGTKTRLFAFSAMENGGYFEQQDAYFDGGAEGYPYVDDGAVGWMEIGSGFSERGKRWQARQVGGKLILNNQVDLPVSYTVGDLKVEPLVELREIGVASVGCIGAANDTLIIGDVSVLKDDALEEVLSPAACAGATAWQEGAVFSGMVVATSHKRQVTASGAVFDSGMVGSRIVFADGSEREISAVINSETAVVGEDLEISDGLPFWVAKPGIASYVVTASAAVFSAQHVGRIIFWDSGDARTILEYLSPTQVRVGAFNAVAPGTFSLENPSAYAAFTDAARTDRFQSRLLWSEVGQPARFGLNILGSATAGSVYVSLKRPTRSFKSGDEVVALGAGLGGGNLTATLLHISDDGRTLILSEPAKTTVSDTEIALASVIGGASAYVDLDDDRHNGAVLGIETLEDKVVVFKDGSIFIGFYSGQSAALFGFRRQWEGDKGLAFPNTLVKCTQGRSQFLMFAGRSNLMVFDLASLVPSEVAQFDVCKGLFYQSAELGDSDAVFACNNSVTQEVWLVVPAIGEDRIIRYNYWNNTVSTSSMAITAGATVRRPAAGIWYGPSENWFVMGTAEGKLLRYGLVSGEAIKVGHVLVSGRGAVLGRAILTKGHIGRTLAVKTAAGWACSEIVGVAEGGVRAELGEDLGVAAGECRILPGIWHRDGGEYESVIETGLDDFNAVPHETRLLAANVTLGGDSCDSPVRLEVLGSRLPADSPDVVAGKELLFPKRENRVRVFGRGRHWGLRVTVSGKNNPTALMSYGVEVGAIGSRGMNVTQTK